MNIIKEIEELKKNANEQGDTENILYRLERIEQFLNESLDYIILKSDPRRTQRK